MSAGALLELLMIMKFLQTLKKYQIWFWPVLAAVLFGLVWWLMSYAKVDEAMVKSIENARVTSFFIKNNFYLGWVLAALSMCGAYLLMALLRIFDKLKVLWLVILTIVANFLPWLVLAVQLIYFEQSYADLIKALIAYSAWPAVVASITVLGLGLVCVVLGDKENINKAIAWWLVLCVLLAVSLRVTVLLDRSCAWFDDQSRNQCYQWSAVQASRLEGCERIADSVFTGMNSNPARDRCYLQIAKTVGKLEACDQIKGGLMSYSREECLQAVAKIFSDPRACLGLKELAQIRCQMSVLLSIKPEMIIELDRELSTTSNAARRVELKAKRAAMYEAMSDERKLEFDKLKNN